MPIFQFVTSTNNHTWDLIRIVVQIALAALAAWVVIWNAREQQRRLFDFERSKQREERMKQRYGDWASTAITASIRSFAHKQLVDSLDSLRSQLEDALTRMDEDSAELITNRMAPVGEEATVARRAKHESLNAFVSAHKVLELEEDDARLREKAQDAWDELKEIMESPKEDSSDYVGTVVQRLLTAARENLAEARSNG